MQRDRSSHAPVDGLSDFPRLLRSVGLTAGLLASAGCSLSPIAKHTVAFDAATRIVVDGSEDGYAAANRLHREVMVSKAVADYDTNPSWSPYNDVKPLLTADQLDARITVLDGLKMYAETLVDLTHPKKNEVLDAAAAGIGSNVRALKGTIAENFRGQTMDPNVAEGVSVAVDALGRFLTARRTQKGLKDATQKMDPTITVLCELLNRDITVLRRQANVDYQSLITSDDLVIRRASVDPFTHREQVGRLIGMAAEQKANDELLHRLGDALQTLEATHQALAAAAQGKDTETIKQKITDLSAAGERLATFYKSLWATPASGSSTSAATTPGE